MLHDRYAHGAIFLLAIIVTCVSLPTQASETEPCREIDDPVERLACYDAKHAEDESEIEKPPRLEHRPRPVQETPVWRSQVVSCREDQRGKYHFYFDNGEVWRQTGGAQIRQKECEFSVTITKDIFGYYMVRDNDKRKLRIRPVTP